MTKTLTILFTILTLVACKEKPTTDLRAATEAVKRTQAEIAHKVDGKWVGKKYEGGTFKNVSKLELPDSHKDHSEYIRYEGPGWESDKIGYRLYLDDRNAIDIFGKKTPDMVLQDVGQDGFSSYHENEYWGMDVLKVGKSLGVGSIGYWHNDKAIRVDSTTGVVCEIVENGNLRSRIKTTYKGWHTQEGTVDLTSTLTIQAGSRLTRHDLSTSTTLTNMCTGIVKHDEGNLITKVPKTGGEIGYLATYGRQSLADDNLGMAVFFKHENFVKLTEDEHSHVVILKPNTSSLTYYFGAAWEQEPDGIKTEQQYRQYLDKTVKTIFQQQ